MAYRAQWRKRTPKGVPNKVEWEDGHDLDGALFKARQALEAGACWAWIEDLESPHKGNSISKPKAKAPAAPKRSGMR